jgi:nitrogen fixation protein NifU and related proteins
MDNVEELYQELLLEHFKNPRCQDPVAEPSVTHLALNPLCGDRVALAVKSEGGIVSQISLQGKGCCISQAAASMLSELCQGKTLLEAQSILESYRAMMRGEKDAEDFPELQEARSLVGVRKFTARMRCALLGCEALDHCLKQCNECSKKGECQGECLSGKDGLKIV